MIGTMRSTRAIIHLGYFAENLRRIREHTKNGPRICLAVKADAYGHGIVPISTAAVGAGVEYLAVATVDEGEEIRSAGIEVPILLYSLPIPEELDSIVEYGLTPIVGDIDLIDALDHAAARHGSRLTVHLKVDTGMGRIGCRPEDAPSVARRVARTPNLELGGTCTHFPVSDSTDETFTGTQIARFDAAVQAIRESGVDPGLLHAANSGAVLAYPRSWYDMVRPGLLAYGYYPSGEQERHIPVRPVMELQSRVVYIKQVPAGTGISYGLTWTAHTDTYIATVPIGYGDGYNRLLSNQAEVLINGTRYPIAGRVCMDQLMVNLGPSHSVRRYDPVILFGPQEHAPTAEELAGLCGTIPYEITCALSRRVPRIPAQD